LTDGVAYDINASMAVLLRHWREQRAYSVRELARRAGVGYVTVVRIENDQLSPTVAMLEKLAKALSITARDFFPSEPRLKPSGKRRHR
jgi:transcriptional regulator with XRE-family HTH domain